MSKVEETAKKAKVDFTFETVIENAVKLPGVKVNRNEFLTRAFEDEEIEITDILELGPVGAGCSSDMIARLAHRQILTRTSESSMVSFVAGIPGGLAMAATIPADVLQFFGMTLRLAQELSYLYGAEDLWEGEHVDNEKIQGQLILYCGVMFGASGASSGVRVIASQMAKQVAKELPKKALTKTFWYPIVKQVAKYMGVYMTKDVLAKGFAKAIPVIGGVISGTITFATMQPMGMKLAHVLEQGVFNYSEDALQKDLDVIESMPEEEIVAEYTEADAEEDVFELIEKLASLKNAGILTDEEFESKKRELMERI